MKRFLLLLLVVAVIVATLVWITNQTAAAHASPPPYGPGEAAWMNQVNYYSQTHIPVHLMVSVVPTA